MSDALTINRLQAENAALRERLTELESLLGYDVLHRLIVRVPLSPTAAQIVALMLKREMVSRDTIMTVVWGMAAEPPLPKIIDVYLSKFIRPPLRQHGIEIVCRWGVGWLLTGAMKAKLRSVIGVAAQLAEVA